MDIRSLRQVSSRYYPSNCTWNNFVSMSPIGTDLFGSFSTLAGTMVHDDTADVDAAAAPRRSSSNPPAKEQTPNRDDRVPAAAEAAAASPPGPVGQSINRILHVEPLATAVHGIYWIVVLSAAVPVSVWVLVVRTLYLFVCRPRYVVFDPPQEDAIDEAAAHVEYALVITGCDSGFGHELAVRAATATGSGNSKGRCPFVVFAGCYSKDNVGPDSVLFRGIDNVRTLHLDVTQDDHVQQAVKHVSAWLHGSMEDGRDGESSDQAKKNKKKRRYLHAIVNNAGVGYGGDADWLSMEQIRHTMDGAYIIG
jgi:hypothetical protein